MNELLKKISNELVLKIGFFISIGILILTSFFSYETNRSLISNAQWVDHTSEVIRKLNSMLLIIKEAQLSQNEFLITNDENSLASYYGAHERLKSELNVVKVLTTDNPSQQNYINKVSILIDEVFVKFDELIAHKKTGRYDRLWGKAEASQMEALITAMKFDELNLLKIREVKLSDSSANAPLMIIFFSFLALVFVTLAYNIISKNIKSIRDNKLKIQEAYEEVQAINEELSSTNEELRASNEELSDSKELLSVLNEKLVQNQDEIVAANEELKKNLDKINIYKIELETTKDRLIEAQTIANVGNWEWNIETNQIYWSDQLIRIFDYDPSGKEKFDYETYQSLIYPDDRMVVDNAVQKILEDQQPYTIEHRLLKKDGSLAWILAKGRAILSNEGKVEKLAGTSLDITEIKVAQTEEQKLIAIIDNSFDFIGLADTKGNTIFVNEAGMNMVGFDTMKDVHATNVTDYFMPEDLAYVTDQILPEVIEKGKWSGEINFRNFKTQQPVPVRWNVFLVKDKTNIPLGIACVCQDLTAEKKIQQELQRMNEELFAAVEELKQAEESLVLINRELETRVSERSKELAVSEERFKLVALATNDAVWDWDLQTDNLWWNEGFKVMFGYQTEQIEPGIESLHSRIHPDDKFRILKEIRLFLVSGKSQWTGEYRFLNSVGKYIHVLDRGYAIYNEFGKPYRMVGSLINITARKELEDERLKLQELAEGQRTRLYELLMNIPAAISIMKGREYIYEMANEKYKALVGDENLINKPRKEVLSLDIADELTKIMDNIYDTGIPYVTKELPVMFDFSEDAEKRYFDLLIEPIYGSSREIEGMMTFSVDVTDKVLARKEIEESSERSRMMLEAIPQMAWTSKPDGDVNYYNEKWYEYTGADFEELKGWGWNRFLHPEDRQRTYDRWNHSLSTGDIYELEYRWKRASDDTYRWMLGRGLPVKNNKGDIMLWVGTCTDIHDQKLIETDLNEKNQELTKVNELLDTFVYTAAHDLKSPVINLKGLFELIKETDEPDTREEYFKTVDLAVTRLDNTINGLVEVIEVQSEDNKIAQKISLKDSLSLVIEELTPALENTGGRIDYDFNQYPDIIYLKSYIHSIFINLIGNAIKYAAKDKTLLINISSYKADGYVTLLVSDNGIGIDLAKYGNKIFKAFNRFTRDAEGKGLGLYLVKTMVERNGGKLEVESEPGVGTTFKIYLKEYS